MTQNFNLNTQPLWIVILVHFGGAVVIFLVGRWLAGLLQRSVRAIMKRTRATPALIEILARGTYYVTLIFALTLALITLGIPASLLLGTLGLIVVVAEVALRESLRDPRLGAADRGHSQRGNPRRERAGVALAPLARWPYSIPVARRGPRRGPKALRPLRRRLEARLEPAGPRGDAFRPALKGRRLYFASSDGRVYCVRSDNGHRVWAVDVGDRVSAPIVLWNGLVPASEGPWAGSVRPYDLVLVVTESGGALYAPAPYDGGRVGGLELPPEKGRLVAGVAAAPDGTIGIGRTNYAYSEGTLVLLRLVPAPEPPPAADAKPEAAPRCGWIRTRASRFTRRRAGCVSRAATGICDSCRH